MQVISPTAARALEDVPPPALPTPPAGRGARPPEVSPAACPQYRARAFSTPVATGTWIDPSVAASTRARAVVSANALASDALVRQLACIRAGLVRPMARAAAALAAHTGWRAYGYRSRADFARERLARDDRWLSDLMRLHATTSRLPALVPALDGSDGNTPLGIVAALQIGRVATPATVAAWIARARQGSLAALRAAIDAHAARHASTARSESASAHATDDPRTAPEVESVSEVPQVRITCRVPADVKLVFEEALELHRNVVGRETGPVQFVQALAGEASSVGWTPPVDFSPRLCPSPTDGRVDAACCPRMSGPDGGTASSGTCWRLALPARASTQLRARAQAGALAQVGARAQAHSSVPPPSSAAHPDRAQDLRALYTPAMRRARQRVLEFDQLRARLAFLERKLARPPAHGRGRIRDLRRLVHVLQSLRRMEDALEIDIGDLLLELHEHRAWKALGCSGLEAYAEERLRMGGSTARKRIGLARQLRRLAVVRQAYATGKLGLEAAQHVGSMLRHSRAAATLQAIWVEHAHTATIKRLRGERRRRERERLLAVIAVADTMSPGCRARRPDDSPSPTARRSPAHRVQAAPPSCARVAPATPMPMQDADWQRSLRLVPGDTCAWVVRLGCGLLDRVVHHGPLMEEPLRFALPAEVAADFFGCIEAARRQLAAHDDSALTPGDDSRLRPSSRIARAFVHRRKRVPDWVGLLALLEEWTLTYDMPEETPDRRSRRIFARDGYRCMAPACTSRGGLQVHHLEHCAWGGGSEPENLIVLCRFHHIEGEHGGLARVRGRAPLDVVWRLGTAELGVWYRNERRLQAPG